MCGIFGSRDFSTYEKLYNRNKKRGTFAGGSLYVKGSQGLYLKKWQGKQLVDELTGEYAFQDDYTTFLGHTQAPTSSTRDYNVKTTHPFEHGWWIVAHNGVLENDKKIRADYLQNSNGECDDMVFDTTQIQVDSAVIPALIDNMYVGDDVLAITEACQKLQGTFACWIYSKHTHQTYLVRSGSTLFGNVSNSNFSSIKVSSSAEEELQEGVVYCITSEGLAVVGKFKQNSPFFIF